MKKHKKVFFDTKEQFDSLSYLKNYKPTEESIERARILFELEETLQEYEAYKNYDAILEKIENVAIKAKKDFCRSNSSRKLGEYLRAENERYELIKQHKQTDIEDVQAKLKRFESILDKRYWDEDCLIEITLNVAYGVFNTIEEAVKNFEKNK